MSTRNISAPSVQARARRACIRISVVLHAPLPVEGKIGGGPPLSPNSRPGLPRRGDDRAVPDSRGMTGRYRRPVPRPLRGSPESRVGASGTRPLNQCARQLGHVYDRPHLGRPTGSPLRRLGPGAGGVPATSERSCVLVGARGRSLGPSRARQSPDTCMRQLIQSSDCHSLRAGRPAGCLAPPPSYGWEAVRALLRPGAGSRSRAATP